MKHNVHSDCGNRKTYANNFFMFMHLKAYFVNNTFMPLGIHKLNIRKCSHYVSITSVLLIIYKQITLNKTMLYNVVFWQSSALTDKILQFGSKLTGCRFWSASVNNLIIPTRAHWVIVGKNRIILKITVRTTENTTITVPLDFFFFHLLFGGGYFCFGYVRFWWFGFGWLVGLGFFFFFK